MEGGIFEDQINLPQLQGTYGSKKKVLADLRVNRPDSSRIQLGTSWSVLTMIWLKRWGICCKDNEIFQSRPVQNWETVSGMLIQSDNPTICAKGVVEHHLSFQKLIKVLKMDTAPSSQCVWWRIVCVLLWRLYVYLDSLVYRLECV